MSIREVVERSALRALSEGALDQILAEAWVVSAAQGELIFRPGDSLRVVLVVDGLARAYLASSDGREATAYYLGPGDIIGLTNLAGSNPPLSMQAVNTVSGLAFPPVTIERMARSDAAFGWEVQEELRRRWTLLTEALGCAAFQTKRQRVVGVLVQSAVWDQAIELPVVAATQQQIADAAGTVREVASRVLSELQSCGLVRLRRGAVELLDIEGLDLFAKRAVHTSGVQSDRPVSHR